MGPAGRPPIDQCACTLLVLCTFTGGVSFYSHIIPISLKVPGGKHPKFFMCVEGIQEAAIAGLSGSQQNTFPALASLH